MIVLQAVGAAESADTTSAAEAALHKVEAMLKPDQAPGSQNLKRLRDQLMLQLSRCVTLSDYGIHCMMSCVRSEGKVNIITQKTCQSPMSYIG